MTNEEIRRMVQEEVRQSMNVVLNASAGITDPALFTEDIESLFPGMPTITKRPVVHPFGFMSRAIKDTISVVVRVGNHIGNRMVIGHRDKGRPTDLLDGEAVVYSSGGMRIYLRNGKVQVGSATAAEPIVLGTQLVGAFTELFTQLDALLDALKNGPIGVTTTPGNPVPPHPTLIAAVTQVRTALDSAKSTYISDEGTNIVSKIAFTERGGS